MTVNYEERDYVASEPPHYVLGEWKKGVRPVVRLLIEPNLDDSLVPDESQVQRLEFTALIDTGASHTVVDTSVAKKLQLGPATNWTYVNCAGSQTRVRFDQYDLTFTIAKLGRSINLSDVPCGDLHLEGIDCLIGLDIIAKGELVFEGLEGRFRYYYLASD